MVETHEEYIAKKRGRDVVDEVARLNYGRIDMKSLAMQAMEILYKEKYDELLKEI
jgi:hypothetical protein